MKEHIFECAEEVHRNTAKGEEWRYKYKVKNSKDQNKFELVLWTEDPYEAIEKTGLPTKKGDSVTIKTGVKNTQTKVVEE